MHVFRTGTDRNRGEVFSESPAGLLSGYRSSLSRTIRVWQGFRRMAPLDLETFGLGLLKFKPQLPQFGRLRRIRSGRQIALFQEVSPT
jgi:hypothetical protein